MNCIIPGNVAQVDNELMLVDAAAPNANMTGSTVTDSASKRGPHRFRTVRGLRFSL